MIGGEAMARHDLKPGDLVKLRSGGPTMTLGEVPGEPHGGAVRCLWFTGATLRDACFPVDALEPARRASGAASIML